MSSSDSALVGNNKPFTVSKDKIFYAAPDTLKDWSEDPFCQNREDCQKEIQRRLDRDREATETRAAALSARKVELEANPFDPRTEVSADAKRIVFHLYVIFLVIPVCAALAYYAITH
ncbi:MAG TPA: hypothetical protein VN736_01270 [Candidatus Limnocylindrales bacterium]|nr:hypothetical protein [Candidatus Limnocylindrales bacterium]